MGLKMQIESDQHMSSNGEVIQLCIGSKPYWISLALATHDILGESQF
jgi:hypothetical protein